MLAGCATHRPEFNSPTRNLTEAEIRSLPPGITFGSIWKLLRSYERSEIAIPMIVFSVESHEKQRCGMFFDEKTGRLLWAMMAQAPVSDEEIEDGVMLWPEEIAGMKVADFIIEQEKSKAKSPK